VSDNAGAQQQITDLFFSDSPSVNVIIGSVAAAYPAVVRDKVKVGLV
jgi:hypothetical protein